MVDVVPYDLMGGELNRWEINGYGIVFGKDLEIALLDHFTGARETEKVEEYLKKTGGEKKR